MEKLILLFIMIGISYGFPATSYDNAEELADLFEGDIDLTQEQIMSIYNRNGVIKETVRWTNNTIDYIISANYSEEQKDYIRKALKTIELVSCLKFIEHSNTTGLSDYVYVVNSDKGCSSNLGRIGGRQTLKLRANKIESGCFRLATIMHEFLHTLGFHHMQNTYNRNDYVSVIWDNIKPENKHNFKRHESFQVTGFDIEYDYNSIMHYGTTVFSKNGLPTMVPIKDPNAEIGQRVGLSRRDIEKLNRMYECPL